MAKVMKLLPGMRAKASVFAWMAYATTHDCVPAPPPAGVMYGSRRLRDSVRLAAAAAAAAVAAKAQADVPPTAAPVGGQVEVEAQQPGPLLQGTQAAAPATQQAEPLIQGASTPGEALHA